MSRSTDERLADVLAACDAIETHVARGPRDGGPSGQGRLVWALDGLVQATQGT